MNDPGKESRRSVAFVGADGTLSPAHRRARLLEDPRDESAGKRHTLLPDGDVWREAQTPAQTPSAREAPGAGGATSRR
jgi:hypothetical protein